jgi:2,3-bisphosphoglycerate-dependent phosphoglycerate mutase
MEMYIIRHAESENNARPVEERVEDPALSDLGKSQAERLAIRLAHIHPTRIFTSPFRRALETIAPYLSQSGQTAEAWIDLHEQGGVMRGVDVSTFEAGPGMTRREIAAEFPSVCLPDEIDQRGWWKGRRYELPEEAAVRAENVVISTRDAFAHTHERVVLISHGLFMSFLISAFLGLPYEGYDRFDDIANTSITKFQITIPHNRMSLLNCIRHLPENWITGVDIRHFRTEILS